MPYPPSNWVLPHLVNASFSVPVISVSFQSFNPTKSSGLKKNLEIMYQLPLIIFYFNTSFFADTIFKNKIIITTCTITLTWTSTSFTEIVASPCEEEEISYTPRFIIETFIQSWCQLQLNIITFMRNNKIYVNYFFCPIGTLISTCITDNYKKYAIITLHKAIHLHSIKSFK